MIEFFYEIEFPEFQREESTRLWITQAILKEGYELGEITIIFCNDPYLHSINLEFLKHDTFTDIITFDYVLGKQINGEIYISLERVKDNAAEYNVPFSEELNRVIIHGILHLCGYKDKTTLEIETMRRKEEEYLSAIV